MPLIPPATASHLLSGFFLKTAKTFQALLNSRDSFSNLVDNLVQDVAVVGMETVDQEGFQALRMPFGMSAIAHHLTNQRFIIKNESEGEVDLIEEELSLAFELFSNPVDLSRIVAKGPKFGLGCSK